MQKSITANNKMLAQVHESNRKQHNNSFIHSLDFSKCLITTETLQLGV